MGKQVDAADVQKRVLGQIKALLGGTFSGNVAVSSHTSVTMTVEGMVYPRFIASPQSRVLPGGTYGMSAVPTDTLISNQRQQADQLLEGAFEKYRDAVSEQLLADQGSKLFRHISGSEVQSKAGSPVFTKSSCGTCQGSGEEYCAICYGSQKINCHQCSGLGFNHCSTCQGHGQVLRDQLCTSCGGAGRDSNGSTCAGCGGAGRHQQWQTCNHCSHGKVDCTYCHLGRTTCTHCVGGLITCRTCAGSLYQYTEHWHSIQVWTRVETKVYGPHDWAKAGIDRLISQKNAGEFSLSGGISARQPTDDEAYATVALVPATIASVTYKGITAHCHLLGTQHEVVNFNGLLAGSVEAILTRIESTMTPWRLRRAISTPLVQGFDKDTSRYGEALEQYESVQNGAVSRNQAERLQAALSKVKNHLTVQPRALSVQAILAKSVVNYLWLLAFFTAAWLGSDWWQGKSVTHQLGWLTPLLHTDAYLSSLQRYSSAMLWKGSMLNSVILWIVAFAFGRWLMLPAISEWLAELTRRRFAVTLLLLPINAILLQTVLALFPAWGFDFSTAGMAQLYLKLTEGKDIGPLVGTLLLSPLTLWPIGLAYALVTYKRSAVWWATWKLKLVGLSAAQRA
ncbi:TPA: hypothetical protein L6A81_12335 [Pseudomonas aeruginosa]|nr:hypothetical protein [Pseudomonas aeruginosa]